MNAINMKAHFFYKKKYGLKCYLRSYKVTFIFINTFTFRYIFYLKSNFTKNNIDLHYYGQLLKRKKIIVKSTPVTFSFVGTLPL